MTLAISQRLNSATASSTFTAPKIHPKNLHILLKSVALKYTVCVNIFAVWENSVKKFHRTEIAIVDFFIN